MRFGKCFNVFKSFNFDGTKLNIKKKQSEYCLNQVDTLTKIASNIELQVYIHKHYLFKSLS